MALNSKTLGGKSQPKETYLSQLPNPETAFEQKYRFMAFVGPSGIGKTEFCVQFPKPMLVINDFGEQGFTDLFQNREPPKGVIPGPPIMDWQYGIDVTKELANTPDHGYATILFESITGFEQMGWDWCIENDWRNDRAEFMNYSKGPKAFARSYWRSQFLRNLGMIRVNGCHVLITGHSRVKPKENLEGSDFSGEVAYCDAETWQQTHGVLEAVGQFWMQPVEKQKTGPGSSKSLRTHVEFDGNRQLVMHKTPMFDAKNRWGIELPINLPDSGGAPAAYQTWCKSCKIDPVTGFFK